VPTVSVVIPTYNRDAVVTRAIDSVLTQTYDDFEVVVVDDCSTDDTRAVVEEYDDARIRYIRHDENQGACAARNTGIEHSDGRYVAFLDSDDEWDETKLAKQVKCMERAPESVGVVYIGYRVKRSDDVELGQVPSKRGDIHRDQLAKDWVSPTSAVLVDRECFESVGTFDTDLAARQDYDMWLRLSRHYEFDYVKEALVTLHADGDDRITADIQSRMDAHQTILERVRADIKGLGVLDRHSILASQYFSIARYLQRHDERRRAAMFFARSLINNPFRSRTWLGAALLVLGVSPDDGVALQVKNRIKRLKLRLDSGRETNRGHHEN
jgi:glycosyltransferase involved in cell wall biosynthesis